MYVFEVDKCDDTMYKFSLYIYKKKEFKIAKNQN